MKSIRNFVRDLQTLYAENGCPSDKLIREAKYLGAFTDIVNQRIGAHFSPEAVAEELQRIRKDKRGTGGLPKVGRANRTPKFRRGGDS